MIKFTLTPYDVLFFGSGRPFNMGDVAASIFPPNPNTFASAICSKIYHLKSINVSGILKAVYGPFILKNSKIYFPKPQNIYKERKKKDIEKVFTLEPLNINLKLFKPDNTSNFAIENLPIFKGIEEIEPFKAFISIDALKNWLNNKEINVKNDILLYKDIFQNEPRIGIKIDDSSYSVTEENALYRIEFLRLKEDIKFVFWVEFNFSNKELEKAGLNDENKIFKFFNTKPKVLKLGGEMRNVSYEIEKNDFKEWIKNELKIENTIELEKGEKIQVLFLSYGIFDFNKSMPQINGFEIYSACFDNYEIIGINSKNLGRKTKRAFHPGAIIWFSVQDSVQDKISLNNPTFIIKNQNNFYFFGEVIENQDFIGTNLVLIKKEVKNV